MIFNLFIIEILELILYLLLKNKVVKKIHYVLYLIFVGLVSILSIDTLDILLALISVISSIIPLIISIIKREDNKAILIFTNIALILSNSNMIFSEIYYLNYLVTFGLMIVYAYLNKDKIQRYVPLFGSAVLLLSFINIIIVDYNLFNCLNLLVYSYIGLLIMSLISDKNSKDWFMTIYFSILILIHLFTSNIWLFLTVTLVVVLMIVISFIKDFKKLKISAIILFILNFIYQLRDFWFDIPVAIYLLVLGLVIIGIVVVKEIKDNKE